MTALMICLEQQRIIKLTTAVFISVTLSPKDPDVILNSLVFLLFTLLMKVANKTTQNKLAQAITSDL